MPRRASSKDKTGFPVPETVPDGSDTVCIQFRVPDIPEATAAATGAVMELTRVANWEYTYQTGDKRASDMAQVMRRVIYASFEIMLACGEDTVSTRFRQSQIDPCILEVSYDGGTNWTTMFNYALCFAEVIQDIPPSTGDVTNNITVWSQQIVDSFNNYNGTPESIAPDMDYDGTAADDDRDRALCAAVYSFVRLAQNVLLEERRRQESSSDNLKQLVGGILTTVGGLIVGAIGLASTNPYLAALAWSLVGGGIALISQSLLDFDETLFLDEAAAAEVGCCMFTALAGSDITLPSFQNSLLGCSFGPGTSAEALRGLIYEMMQDTNVYLQFLEVAQSTIATGGTGSLPCDCPDYCHLFDLTADASAWTIEIGGFTLGTGIVGVWSQGGYADPTKYGQRVAMRLPVPPNTDIQSVRIKYETGGPANDSGIGSGAKFGTVDTGLQTGLSEGIHDTVWQINTASSGDLVIWAHYGFTTNTTAPARFVHVIEVEVCGGGPDPF